MYPTLWIDPSSTVPYYTMSVWHVQECRYTQVTYTTPSMNRSGKKPWYTTSVSHVEQCRHTHIRCIPPTNGTQCYRALLHHFSFICGRVQMYPCHIYPTPMPPSSPWEQYSAGEQYYVMSCFYLLHRYVLNAKISTHRSFSCLFTLFLVKIHMCRTYI